MIKFIPPRLRKPEPGDAGDGLPASSPGDVRLISGTPRQLRGADVIEALAALALGCGPGGGPS
ncbi:MAG TPA: hypothetical protein VLM11_00110 [Streptosporangiaceae bacterium]|nr:hypothetical protein [Streptosporangiaceae bacterium]